MEQKRGLTWWGPWDDGRGFDGAPAGDLHDVADDMAHEMAERIVLRPGDAETLRLICYRAIVRTVPKLRSMGFATSDTEIVQILTGAKLPSRAAVTRIKAELRRLGLAWEVRVQGKPVFVVPRAVLEIVKLARTNRKKAKLKPKFGLIKGSRPKAVTDT